MPKLSTEPYKGARDFYPEEKRIQNYIFNIWRETALSFGYEEYDAPLLEKLEVYEAKSGEELVNNQLYSLEDKGGRKVAIRPEKTPSVARMVAAKLPSLPRPIRWFNIGNCWRYEKPQKGRGREFYQFDCDIFGENSINADVEVFSIPLEVMKKLGATKGMFELRVNNRKFAEFYLKEVANIQGEIAQKATQLYRVTKSIDSKPKIAEKEFTQMLESYGLSDEQISKVNEYLNADLDFVTKFVNQNEGAKQLIEFLDLMGKMGYKDFIRYSPEIMRGLDYYTGIVVEQFDLNPKNNRAMYGGGRYDNLIGLFSDQKLTGVGFAMGDITLLEFLKEWNLLPQLEQQVEYFVALWQSRDSNQQTKYTAKTMEIAQKIRQAGYSCLTQLDYRTSISQQLATASKKGIKKAIIAGEKELEKNTIGIKNLTTGEQKEIPFEEFLENLKRSNA